MVVFSESWSTHIDCINSLFVRLKEAQLTVNLAKCEFVKATVTYLGKQVGQCQVRPLLKKKKELIRFLGLVGYYRCFCRNFSTVVAQLTDLLKAKAKFVWSPSC